MSGSIRLSRLAAFVICALSGALIGAFIAVILTSAAYAAPLPSPPTVEPIPPTAATIRGTATWYCASRSACTHGYGPSDLVAAIDPTLGIPKGTRLTVSSGSRSVTVTVVDVCACAGPRVIDLTSGAFRRLAPLSLGTIAVTLSTGGPLPTAPSTDTLP